MDLTFGARLRSLREQQRISLAETAKIGVVLLEGLETMYRAGQGGRRAYMRSYAQAIGADAKDLVREFVEGYPG